ncbi:hypothetical protein [Onishia taeanensis]
MRSWIAIAALMPTVAWGHTQPLECFSEEAEARFLETTHELLAAQQNGVSKEELEAEAMTVKDPILRATRLHSIDHAFDAVDHSRTRLVQIMQTACFTEQT